MKSNVCVVYLCKLVSSCIFDIFKNKKHNNKDETMLLTDPQTERLGGLYDKKNNNVLWIGVTNTIV